MHIEKITLQNFRSFGPEPETVRLGPDITALIGSNGTGKSALLEALRRLFGVTREERTLTRADVHFGPDETPDEVDEREIVIDVVFAFPELEEDDEAAGKTVPDVFGVMTASKAGEPPRVRLRLEALWKRGESFEDDIETQLYWVTRLDEVEFGGEGGANLDKQRVSGPDRAKIQLVYIPATRDSRAVTQTALRQLLRRLERSGEFGPDTERTVEEVSSDRQQAIDDLPAVQWITERLKANWGSLHSGAHLNEPRLTVISQEFVRLLRSLTARLSPGPEGRDRDIGELSEGQTSLFYLALAATVAQLERALARTPRPEGFSELEYRIPALTIYAIEEPESHLAPFYLSRLMGLLRELCAGPQAMGLVTSHAPGALGRIEPEHVRHFRLDTPTLSTRVRAIRMPEDDADAAKYLRQAVLAHPEIYFARLVILGEGDSEALVIPRVAKALGVDLDPSFIAFAPLGGRHVNHFWRLLNDLEIPYLTLLDFDLGRSKAGPLRLKYAYDKLREVNSDLKPKWHRAIPKGSAYWKEASVERVGKWMGWLGGQGVFFSHPLDLDMMMLRAFPEAYGVETTFGLEEIDALEDSVFGEKGPGLAHYDTYADPDDRPTEDELARYDVLFKKRGKPGSHLEALAELSDETIRENCPEPLRALIEAAEAKLAARAGASEEDEA